MKRRTLAGIVCGAAILVSTGYIGNRYYTSYNTPSSNHDAAHNYIGFSPRGENVLAADKDGLKRVRVWDENGKFYLDERVSVEVWDNSQTPPADSDLVNRIRKEIGLPKNPQDKIEYPLAQTFVFDKPVREGNYTIEVTDVKNNIQVFQKSFKPEG